MPNYDIEAIWKRLRKKVDLSKIKGLTPKQWKKNFIAEMKSGNQAKNLDKIGRKGFFVQATKKIVFPKETVFVQRYDGKTAVLDKRGKTHLIKSENLKITESTWKGKKTVYVSNTRTGKRVTSSFLPEENQE